MGSKSEVMVRHSGDSSNSSNNVDQILTNFDHLPPLSGQLGTFYILPILCSRHKVWTFYWPPTLSCSRSYWMTPKQQRRASSGPDIGLSEKPPKEDISIGFWGALIPHTRLGGRTSLVWPHNIKGNLLARYILPMVATIMRFILNRVLETQDFVVSLILFGIMFLHLPA